LGILLSEGDCTQSKAFLRSFVKKVIINGDKAKIQYRLPMSPEGKKIQSVSVLPTDTLGGAEGIRTPYLLNANQAFSRVNYGPATPVSSRTDELPFTLNIALPTVHSLIYQK
jgi:site-specific DNA recombinase